MEQLYKTSNYTIWGLLGFLDNWDIWLPDLQRPFVWNTTKVRNLFDSLYKWYPVGFFLLWDVKNESSTSSIWINKKNHTANRVIIDWQQRLTSLYAVMKWVKVKDSEWKWIKIKLAFNPITNEIAVSTPALENSSEWIWNITEVWTKDKDEWENTLWSWNILSVVNNYLSRYEKDKEITLLPEDKENIQNNIIRLNEIKNFNFTALEVSSEVWIEEISDIFVRINSEWKQLNQSDFILTLLSVYWEEWRKEIETFCFEKKNPFNHLLAPQPEDIIKILVSYTFFKWRLKDMYNLLRWRDTITRAYNENLKYERIELLKENLTIVLNENNWASFFKIIIWVWCKSKKLISWWNTLLFTYIIYLIWKNKFKIEYNILEKYIWKYYIFCLLSAKYSQSTETTLEEELKSIEELKTSEQFLEFIDNQILLIMWDDFWNNTLINDIKSSSIRNNVYIAYLASKVFMNTRILFSNNLFWDLINDELTLNKQLLDNHHIFPKNYLSENFSITDIKDTNQVANFIYLWYNDNIKISDKSPKDYYEEMIQKYWKEKVNKWLTDNDIPLNFFELSYNDFLVERRKLMIKSIKNYFKIIETWWIVQEQKNELDIDSIIKYWESNTIEFKSTLRWDIFESCINKKLEFVIIKTINAFLNTNWWTLLIWVEDNWNIYWIESDYKTLSKNNSDWFLLNLDNLIDNNLWKELHKFIKTTIKNYNWKDIAIVEVEKSSKPVFINFEWQELFFIRAWSSTRPMSLKEFNEYKELNWKNI